MKLAVALFLATSLAAQDPGFDAQSRLVLVPVTVTDAKGRSVDGLDAADFAVLDNGRPQRVAVDTFGTGVAPLALVIAVQSSGISAPALDKVRKIASMVQPVVTGVRGCAALVAFDERVRWHTDCTSDGDTLQSAFNELRPGEEKSARQLDAVHEAIKRLTTRPNVRRVLLLVSESRDRGSEAGLETVVAAAQAAGVTIYAATYSAFRTAFTTKPSDNQPPVQRFPGPRPPPDPLPNQVNIPIPPPAQRVDILGGIGELVRLGKTNTTEVLTAGTGGTVLPFLRQRGLETAIEKLGAELHSQYVLSFAPEAPAPGYHPLQVQVTRPGAFRVRARPGYWATARP